MRGEEGPRPSPGGADGWLRYRDDLFGLSFHYPSDWNGPEVHRRDAGVTAEVGTDTVYPYGTGLDERHYEVEDAYFIAVSYVENLPGWQFDEFVANQPWMQSYLQLQEIADGESISDPRSLTIRQREVAHGDFRGIEYISTLSETAQTMTFYAREVLLFDEDLNSMRISGSPNNVVIREGEDWREAHRRVDESFQADFHLLLDSVNVE